MRQKEKSVIVILSLFDILFIMDFWLTCFFNVIKILFVFITEYFGAS